MLRSLFSGLWARTATLSPLPEEWDFETTAESFPAITTPATYSFARRYYRTAYRDLARLRGLPDRRCDAYEDVFDGILGFRDGWIGVRVDAWTRYEELLATLPPIRCNLAERVGSYLPRLELVLATQRQGLPDLAAGELVARYHAFEAAAFRDAGLAVATDMQVLSAYAAAAAALAEAGVDPRGPDGVRILAQGGFALASALRGPGEMLLERRAPAGGPDRAAALMVALSRRVVVAAPPGPEAARPAVSEAKAWIAWRERMRGGRAAIFDGARAILGELGRRVGLGAGVWNLEVAEILALPGGPVPAGRFDRLPRYAIRPPDAGTNPDGLSGTIAWPGSVIGAARIITDPAGAPDLNGDILVAERTDPGWTPLFASAGAILVQHGNPLCHAAILARELGIPAIVGIRGLLAAVRDGDRLEVDARTGTVRILR